MLEKYKQDLEQSFRNHPLNRDQFDSWKNNPVTKRFFAEMELAAMSVADNIPSRGDPNLIVQVALELTNAIQTYESVVTWVPSELGVDNEA